MIVFNVIMQTLFTQGTEVVVVRARGPLTETILYGIDLPIGSERTFEIDSSTGNITVGFNGSARLVVRGGVPTTLMFDVFAYYQSSGLSGSRVIASHYNSFSRNYAILMIM